MIFPLCLTRKTWLYGWSHAVVLALFGVVCKFPYSNRRTFSKHKISKYHEVNIYCFFRSFFIY
ncbi:hypothetical protein AW45_24795 [Salmonella enterica subsp. enterica serovar Typhimurium str. USDA-ARS-USMARC-1810]|nr:hypothetical protein AW45_24795 [Salmonella enterica subsp. enterica serovar Typhimurium str. USDA-ARS-USMARC-1810]